MFWALFYGFFALVSAINFFLMKRVKAKTSGGDLPVILVPARNEEPNIGGLVSQLHSQGLRVMVLDDQSEDRTAQLAKEAGATVIRGSGPAGGSTGKSWACHNLALAAAEDSSAKWMFFLDADVKPEEGFAKGLAGWINESGRKAPVLTGFPRFLPGKGLEPAYLSWMTWILLCTNPFGLVSATGKGHNMFTNGQVTGWQQDVYMENLPHKEAGAAVLEDVTIGRLLAKRQIRVETANLSGILAVRMYDDLFSAWKGMTKNSAEIAGQGWRSWLLAGFLCLVAIGWMFAGQLWLVSLLLLLLSRVFSNGISRHPWWIVPALPLTLLAGAATIVASSNLHRTGKVEWKGRNLGPKC